MKFNTLFNQKNILINIFVAIFYICSAKSMTLLSFSDTMNIFAIWPSTGIALAFLLIFGRTSIVGIFVGTFLFYFGTIQPLFVLSMSFESILGPLAAMYVIRKAKIEANYLSTLRNVAVFLSASVVASVVMLLVDAINIYLLHYENLSTIYGPWHARFFSDLIGCIAFAPLITAASVYFLRPEPNFRLSEFLAMLFTTLASAFVVFGPPMLYENSKYPLAFLLITPALWAVFRFSPLVSVIVLNIIGFLTTLGTMFGNGPFARGNSNESLMLVQIFMMTLSVAVLLIIGLINEKESVKAQLEELNKTLEEKIEEEILKARKNQSLLAQQAKMAAMGEMIGAIAHQWRQPLNTLGIMIQDLRYAQRDGDLTKELLDGTVTKAMGVINFMSKTIDDFRSFFRPDKQKAVFDIFKAVVESVRLLEVQLKINNINLMVKCPKSENYKAIDEIKECDERTYKIFGYQNEFKQVVLNMVSNAKDAILSTLKKGDEGLISILIEVEGKDILLSFADNGGGIHDVVAARIFEPYFTTKEQGKGTGIGLYMSKMIIEENMDGKLSFANGKNGAVFTVRLELHE